MSLQSTQQLAPSPLPDFILNPNPEIYLNDNYAVLDFETTNFDNGSAVDGRNRLILAVLKLGSGCAEFRGQEASIFVLEGSEYEQQELIRRLSRVDYVVAHHSKFELQWLARAGVGLRTILPYCTQIGEYVLAGNRKVALSLDATAKRYGEGGKLRMVNAMIKGGVNPLDIPRQALIDYCKEDVLLTERIFLKQRKLLAEKGLLPVTYCRNVFTPVLADMEFEGMQLDEERVQEEFEKVSEQFNGAKLRLDRLTGGLNQNSPKQVREFLYGKLAFSPPTDYKGSPIKTAGGELATGKAVIAKLEGNTREQREFLDAIRSIAPLKKKIQILEKMRECCKEDKGHVYASFNQTITQTHRLSSNGRKYGFQFHNFPREYKRLFRARNGGCVLSEGDAVQLEFRVAVELGHDPRGLRAICEGVDVHQLSSKVMGLDRTAAKAFTFKPLYGGTSGTDQERKYYEAFRREYSSVYNTQRKWTYDVLSNHYLRIASGLIFYWDDTKITKTGYITNTPSIFNYPVQSFATADIVPLSIVCLWHRLEGSKIPLINTVHDSVVAEVPETMVQYYREQLIEAFTKDIYTVIERLYGRKLKVPLGVGIKIAQHWGEGKEEKVESADKIQAGLQANLGNDGWGTGGRGN